MFMTSNEVSLEKKAHFLGIKQSISILVQTLKNMFSAKICCKFLAFFSFLQKNAENDYFDQRLECAAPKRWSKYTTLSLVFPNNKTIEHWQLEVLFIAML